MQRAFLPSSAPAQRLSLLECTPCALAYALRRQDRARSAKPWDLPAAELAVHAMAASVALGGAAEVLVPASLVNYKETQWRDEEGASSAKMWQALLEAGRLVVLVGHREVEDLLRHHPAYRKLCVPVPGGPIAAKMLFGQTENSFYAEDVPRIARSMAAAATAGDAEWRAWMRSGLTCRYEGAHTAPIRVSEHAAALLKDAGGCTQVILEEAVGELRPRWLETMAKTALSCGVPVGALSLALCDAPNADRLMAKAVEVGISRFATTTLRAELREGELTGGSLFTGAEPLIRADTATAFAVGWGDSAAASDGGGSGVSPSEEALLSSSQDYAAALADEWTAFLTSASS